MFKEECKKALVFHTEPIGSYHHHTLVVDCCFVDAVVRREFKLEVVWVEDEAYRDIVRREWSEVEGILEDRLDSCTKLLIKWSRKNFPNFKKLRVG